jgi:hypothetical protein
MNGQLIYARQDLTQLTNNLVILNDGTSYQDSGLTIGTNTNTNLRLSYNTNNKSSHINASKLSFDVPSIKMPFLANGATSYLVVDSSGNITTGGQQFNSGGSGGGSSNNNNPVNVTLKLNIDDAIAGTPEYKTSFLQGIASQLYIDPSRLTATTSTAGTDGSTFISFTIHPLSITDTTSSASNTPSALATKLASFAQDPTSQLATLFPLDTNYFPDIVSVQENNINEVISSIQTNLSTLDVQIASLTKDIQDLDPNKILPTIRFTSLWTYILMGLVAVLFLICLFFFIQWLRTTWDLQNVTKRMNQVEKDIKIKDDALQVLTDRMNEFEKVRERVSKLELKQDIQSKIL